MFWESTEKFVNKLWVDFASVPSFDLFVEEALFKLGGLSPNFSRPLNPPTLGDFEDVSPEIRDFESVPPSIGGPGGQMGQISQERRNFFLSFLNQKPYFLVLDNLESLLNESGEWHNPDYGEFFQEWRTRGRSSTILVTTRERPPGWQEFVVWLPTLTGFSIEEGTEFLTDEGLVGSHEEKANLVQCLDGHPLSLRLAASFLRSYYQGQISEAGELQLSTLGEEARGLHRGEESVLFQLLQQHLQRLTAPQLEFLLNLSVYRVAITPGNAAPMLSGENNSDLAVRKSLRQLANRSLLNKAEAGSYKIHPLITPYLHSQVEESLLVAAHQKAIGYFSEQFKSQFRQTLADAREYLEVFYHWCELNDYKTASSHPPNLIGIYSPRGIGKSYLATYAYQNFTKGFVKKLWVDFTSVPSFDFFMEEALFKLGGLTPQKLPQTPQERHDFFLCFLNQQHYFLVLDNLEFLLNESGEWRNEDYGKFFGAWQSRGNSSVILVTTREKPPSLQEFVTWLPIFKGFSREGGKEFLTEVGIVGSEEEKGDLVECLAGHPSIQPEPKPCSVTSNFAN